MFEAGEERHNGGLHGADLSCPVPVESEVCPQVSNGFGWGFKGEGPGACWPCERVGEGCAVGMAAGHECLFGAEAEVVVCKKSVGDIM